MCLAPGPQPLQQTSCGIIIKPVLGAAATAMPVTGLHTTAVSRHDLGMQAAECRVGGGVERRDGRKVTARRCCALCSVLGVAAAYQLLQEVAPSNVPACRPVCRRFWNAHSRRGHRAGKKAWVWLLQWLPALLLTCLLLLGRLQKLVWLLLLRRDCKAATSTEGCSCLCILRRALHSHAGCSLGVEDGCGCGECVQRSREGRPGGGSGAWDRNGKWRTIEMLPSVMMSGL